MSRETLSLSLQQLPAEILVLIVSHLSHSQQSVSGNSDMAAVACTCRMLSAAVKTVMRARAQKRQEIAHRWIDAHPGLFGIAGSAALWEHLGQPAAWSPTDVDAFDLDVMASDCLSVKSPHYYFNAHPTDKDREREDAKVTWLEPYCTRTKEYGFFGKVVTFHLRDNIGDIQLVQHRSRLTLLSEIMGCFDLSVCAIGYTTPGEWIKAEIFSLDPVRRYLRNQLDPTRRRKRLAKYAARGFVSTESC